MANQEHVRILRTHGGIWNEWRRQDPATRLDLSGISLIREPIVGLDLRGTDLRQADLSYASLREVALTGANLRGARLMYTTFSNIDFRGVKGLEEVDHQGPSIIGLDTLYASGGVIPEAFLRGCGVPDSAIKFAESLVGSDPDLYSCFISYCHRGDDLECATQILANLRSARVDCWFAPEDLKPGDVLDETFEEAIRKRDKLLVVLSKDSINSPRVEDEIRVARAEERRRGKEMIVPVHIDLAVKDTDKVWAKYLWDNRHSEDFQRWASPESWAGLFQKLLAALKSEPLDVTEWDLPRFP